MVVLFLVLLVSLKKLEPIQNQGLRICLEAYRTSAMQSLYVEANEAPLYLRFDKLCIQYALKLRSNPDNPAYNVVFNPQFYDQKPSAIRSFGHRVEKDLSVVCPQLDLIQTVSLPDDPPWTVQKPHIDLYLTHQKKHLGDDCLFQSLFTEFKSSYPDHRAIRQKIGLLQLLYQITSVPRSDFLTMLVYSQLNYRLLKWSMS